jgi:hypothetical protein
MKTRLFRILQVLLSVLFCAALLFPLPGSIRSGLAYSGEVIDAPLAPVGAEFTYQGQLRSGSQPVSSTCDFQFSLYDVASGGSPVSGPIDRLAVPVQNGLFTTQLDFGASQFAGDSRWLEIAVRCPAGGGFYTILGRQSLTATPYSLYALNAGQLNGQPANFYQARVNGNCGAGGYIQAINPDGSVVCQADSPLNRALPPQANHFAIVDGPGTVQGAYSSITIGVDGLALISYMENVGANLKVAHCNDPLCSSATLTSYELPVAAYQTSIIIGSDGMGLISYYEGTDDELRVAHCNNIACTDATISTVDNSGDVGQVSSITIGVDGLALISYYDYTHGDLKVAHCSNLDCSAATYYALDDIGPVGNSTSITLGADGLGLISYTDGDNYDLNVAHCNDQLCTTAITTTLDSSTDLILSSAITMGSDGFGLISYYDYTNGDLKVAHCNNPICSNVTLYTLDSTGDVGNYSSITIGADGLGLITYEEYIDSTNAVLKAAHCRDVLCSSAATFILDSSPNTAVGPWSSVTIGTDGRALIGYGDYTNWSLKVLHCSSIFCMTYFRRR